MPKFLVWAYVHVQLATLRCDLETNANATLSWVRPTLQIIVKIQNTEWRTQMLVWKLFIVLQWALNIIIRNTTITYNIENKTPKFCRDFLLFFFFLKVECKLVPALYCKGQNSLKLLNS